MPRLAVMLGVCVMVVLPVVAVEGHHSFFGEFDINQPLRVTGTVTKIEWTNPHMHFVLEVKGRNGGVTNWIFSGDAASALTRRGVTDATLKVGDVVRVDGYRALDGSTSAAAGAVRLPNGKRIFVGPLQEPTPI
jgi:Family of unknown function (DUF6152)